MNASTKIVLLRGLQGVTLAGAILLSGLLAYAGFGMGDSRCGESKTEADLAALGVGVAMHQIDTGEYPTTQQGLSALCARPDGAPKGWRGPYLQGEVPRDAWDQEYVYRAFPMGFELFSKGPDGIAGTPDDIRRAP